MFNVRESNDPKQTKHKPESNLTKQTQQLPSLRNLKIDLDRAKGGLANATDVETDAEPTETLVVSDDESMRKRDIQMLYRMTESSRDSRMWQT